MFSSGRTPHPKNDVIICTALTVLALVSVITQHGRGLDGSACVIYYIYIILYSTKLWDSIISVQVCT